MTHDVFVSHSSKDKLVADAICAKLEQENIRCWIAPRDIVPGSDWAESIIQALEHSKLLTLVFSSNSDQSSQVKREVERAAGKGIPIIPFRIEDIAMSKSLEFFTSTSHWLDALSPPLEKHIQHLSHAVQILLDAPDLPQSQNNEILKELERASEDGNVDAMVNLGIAYALGKSVKKDSTKMLAWFQKAAALGSPVATGNVGFAYWNGDGVARDYSEAVRWFQRAVDLGDTNAINNLGLAYWNGYGVDQDYEKAVELFNHCLKTGDTNVNAQFNLGLAYLNGYGVQQDYERARKLLEEASTPDAVCTLGYMYESGKCGPSDKQQALALYKQGAQMGSAQGMYNYAMALESGRGITSDFVEAVKWYRKSAQAGHDDANARLETLGMSK